jgi:hypothetical protein
MVDLNRLYIRDKQMCLLPRTETTIMVKARQKIVGLQ